MLKTKREAELPFSVFLFKKKKRSFDAIGLSDESVKKNDGTQRPH
jgi:hypothetical protein